MRNIFEKLPFTLIFLIFLFLAFPTKIMGQSILFEDNFNDGNADGWIVPRDTCTSDWQMNGSSYGINVSSSCITETIPSDLNIPITSSYTFEVDMFMAGSTLVDRNFVFKYSGSSNWYGIHTYGNNVFIQKVVGNSVYPAWSSTFPFTANGNYHFRVEVLPTQIKVFINGVLNNDVVDPPPTFLNSSAGLQASGPGTTWFDNILVTEIVTLPSETPSPTPTPSPSPTEISSPSPSPTPIPTIGTFELPFNYVGRLGTNSTQFKSAFWQRVTAVFDHTFRVGIFRPFTGESYSSCTVPVSCYDSHNGSDFSTLGGQEALSVSDGIISYTSAHDSNSCIPEKGGFGCVVVIQYPGNIYGLFAHLDRIHVNVGDFVDETTQIGEMGKTGCLGCGEHLHFGILRPQGLFSLTFSSRMPTVYWQDLLFKIKPDPGTKFKPACTYRLANGTTFSFQDPSGWIGTDTDPWSLPRSQSGCGTNSPYLWKYEIGSTP